MKGPDLDRERSELKVSTGDFVKRYNTGLPEGFPRASRALLREYQEQYPSQFKPDGMWSLDLHRKKFMDWLPMHLKSVAEN